MKMLRTARKTKALTMKELGEKVGVSESAISQYETGKREADFETLLKIGEVLDCSIDYLLRGEQEKTTHEDVDALSENKNSPGTTEAAPGDARISLEESNHLLIALGLIKEGQQLSVDDLAFLTHIIGLLEAWFSKRQ